MLETQLNLTDDQIAQVKTILRTEEDKARSVKTNTDLSPDEKRDQTEALRKETRQQINAILTPDQRQRLRQAQRSRLAGKPADSTAGAPGTQLVPATP
jgi:Spy/CpxP family protein refolding chaperone